ncbi:triple tyrosine motif-containing protein [Massilia niabensis]|uniref:Triple tyrosine motif-containing protein n=1 Tax=Massilia niabensis TaxID=544910 RepID=A0ABW0L5I7_9BURK
MRALSLPSFVGEARPLAASAAGELWIDHMYLNHADAPPQAFSPASTLGTMTTVVYRSTQGEVWRADYDGLWRVQGLVSSRVPMPAPFASKRGPRIFSLAKDDSGGLWASFGPSGIWRLQDGIWTPHGSVAQLRDFAAISIVAGPDGTLWFASPLKKLAVLRDGIVRHFDASDGLTIGGVLHVSPVGKGAYLGGEGGMAYFDGERILPFLGEGGQQFSGATGIGIATNGDLWAYTARGLVWVTAAELARSRAKPGYQPRFRRFDENDGLQSGAAGMMPIPSMVQSASGELFLSTSGNVFRFDPARLATNRLEPPVHVTTVNADGKQHRPVSGLTLAPRPETVRIDYTALSMALPQQVRFRYQLEGIDQQWQNADTRRAAFYTQLAPGNYTFRVTAANEDGLWNQKGARIDFVIPPPTQTLWFKLLCAAAVGVAAWLLYRVRVRAALKRHTFALEARMAERERIARDLHDTLLQSVQGLILSFKRVANRTADPSTKLLMDQALTLAVDVLVEGRNKVGGLREGVDAGDLVTALNCTDTSCPSSTVRASCWRVMAARACCERLCLKRCWGLAGRLSITPSPTRKR